MTTTAIIDQLEELEIVEASELTIGNVFHAFKFSANIVAESTSKEQNEA
jgi:hypothetical protein